MSRFRNRLPAALAAGSFLVAAAMLVARGEPVVLLPAAAPTTELPPAPIPAARLMDPGDVRQLAQSAVTRALPEIRRQCWTPPAPGELERMTMDIDVTFDAQGEVLMFALSERRDGTRQAVAECVRKQAFSLPVGKPGASVRVFLELTLP